MWAECQFVDPIADIAVLGSVDGQELYDEAAAYDDLTDEIDPLPIADAPEKGSAWLLSLDGQWLQCERGVASDRSRLRTQPPRSEAECRALRYWLMSPASVGALFAVGLPLLRSVYLTFAMLASYSLPGLREACRELATLPH